MTRPLLNAFLTTLAVSIAGCQPAPLTGAPPAAPHCAVNGTVQSAEIQTVQRGYPYVFNIYLPPCYEPNGHQLYPVLYLVPGRGGGPSAWFDAGAAAAADAAIINAGIPPFMIVTTETTDNDPLAETIVNELMPYIEAHYRIRPGRNYHAVAGGSLGGIAAYRVAFQNPEDFGSAGVFGSGLVAGEEPRFSAWLHELTKADAPRVFLNSGEQDPYMLERARVLQSMLEGAGLESTLIFGPGGHDYGYWISNLPEYFAWLAQGW